MANWKNETALVTEGGYGSGFWKWNLTVDLEDLQNGKGEDAFSISHDHDTYGQSFSVYHGISREYSLPDGVTVSAVQELIDDIVERADELTKGFESYWNGRNHIGRFAQSEFDDSTGEFIEVSDEVDAAARFWDELGTTLADMDCLQPYDLNYGENVPFVIENIKQGGFELNGEADVLKALNEAYSESNGENIFTNFHEAAATIWEQLQDEREKVEA